jgi:RecB family exonuclease
MTAGHAFGGNLHRTLQAFHDRGGAEQVPLHELLQQLRERWSEAGFASPDETAAHLAAGEALLERYHAAAPEPGRSTLWTEQTVQRRYAEFVLFGKVDRLDRRPDGSLEVIDYKSGRLTVCEEDVRASLALGIYQLLVSRESPDVPVHASILCLRSGEIASTLRGEEELNALEDEVTEIVRTILADGGMAPVPGDQCRGCVYPSVCPAGRRWLREHHPG